MKVHKVHTEKTDLPSSYPSTYIKKQGSQTPSKLNVVIYDLFLFGVINQALHVLILYINTSEPLHNSILLAYIGIIPSK